MGNLVAAVGPLGGFVSGLHTLKVDEHHRFELTHGIISASFDTVAWRTELAWYPAVLTT